MSSRDRLANKWKWPMGREGADGNLESKSLGCGGICCHGRKLVSVEGEGCSKRSIWLWGGGRRGHE